MIYFVHDEATLFIKVGFTDRDINDRLREFQTGCPGLLTPLLLISGTRHDEQAWHKRFAGARVRGEWFRPTPELLQAIDDLKTSIEENLTRILQKLQKEQEEFLSSGGRPWSAEEIEYLRVLQWQEEQGAVSTDNK